MSRRAAGLRVVAFGLRALDGVEGGIETHARELYPRLAARGLRVDVLVRRRYAGARGERRSPGLRSHALWAPRGHGVEAFGHSALCTLACLVLRPDVVHVHGIGPGAFAAVLRAGRLRVVLTHHGHDYEAVKWGATARLVLRWSERISVRAAHEVITVSAALAADLARDHGRRARVIRNGLPARRDPVPHAAPVPGLDPQDRYVLVVGRLTAHKRVLDVLSAVRAPALDGHRLVVCGDTGGSDRYAQLVVEAARGDPRVLLAGRVDPEHMGWLYEHAACTVMASSYEGLPLAVLEAIGAGCPVLLSTIPAHVELGLPAEQYFPVGDVARLRDRLGALLARPRESAAAAQAALLSDPGYAWEHIADATAEVLRGCRASAAAP